MHIQEVYKAKKKTAIVNDFDSRSKTVFRKRNSRFGNVNSFPQTSVNFFLFKCTTKYMLGLPHKLSHIYMFPLLHYKTPNIELTEFA